MNRVKIRKSRFQDQVFLIWRSGFTIENQGDQDQVEIRKSYLPSKTEKNIYYENLNKNQKKKRNQDSKKNWTSRFRSWFSLMQDFQLVSKLNYAKCINQQNKIKPIILCRKQIKQKICEWKKYQKTWKTLKKARNKSKKIKSFGNKLKPPDFEVGSVLGRVSSLSQSWILPMTSLTFFWLTIVLNHLMR